MTVAVVSSTLLLLLSAVRVRALAAPTRRAFLKAATTTTTALISSPALAFYTKEDYCKQSDAESKRGIAFGCEEYVTDPEKIASMRTRALDSVKTASADLDAVPAITNAFDGGAARQRLRLGALSSLRKEAKRLIVLDGDALSDAYAAAIGAIEALDLQSRRLELDDGPDALLTANQKLGDAQDLLRAFLAAATKLDEEKRSATTS